MTFNNNVISVQSSMFVVTKALKQDFVRNLTKGKSCVVCFYNTTTSRYTTSCSCKAGNGLAEKEAYEPLIKLTFGPYLVSLLFYLITSTKRQFHYSVYVPTSVSNFIQFLFFKE